MLPAHAAGDRVLEIAPVTSVEEILLAQRAAIAVHASEPSARLHRRGADAHAQRSSRRARREPARRPDAAEGREGATPCSTAARTRCPTTYSGSRQRCSPTG